MSSSQKATLSCDLYASAFSGEVVFAVKTFDGGHYEGVAPKHFATPTDGLSQVATQGTLRVKLIRNGGESALVAFPDGESAELHVEKVCY